MRTAEELYVGIRYQVNNTVYVVDQIKINKTEATVCATKEDGSFNYSVTLDKHAHYFQTI
jgi:hypothetical protein